ncbi:MAG: hypothetical protein HF962_05285 [Sulfurovum sp.]|nr:hypothetical protein [Sulfurovum sp.]
MMKNLFLLALLFCIGCEDKAMVNIYHKDIIKSPVPCLKLKVTPYEKEFANVLKKLYHFQDNCTLVLEVSHKNDIQCNSSHNTAKNTPNTFPNSYLRMELRRGLDLQYSYYIDLHKKADEKNVIEGWERIDRDLMIAR